jgi:hypothetical protein
MATDATFEKIQKITPCENSDNLEVATVSNFPCIVRKGEFREGDWCFYVRDDAKLSCYDSYRKRIEDERISAKTDDFMTCDVWQAEFPWQTNLMKYLGSNGRVKTIKLRGHLSMGILLKPETVLGSRCDRLDDTFYSNVNTRIRNEESGANYLKKHFGVEHWVAPISGGSMGQTDARGPLCDGVWKTDEENFENIDDSEFPWGEDVLETAKLDGTSTSILSTPEGEVHVMSRSLDLKLDCDNVYTRAVKDVVPLVKALAKHYGKTICVRGETVGEGINASKVNKDARGKLTFNMFSVTFPKDPDYACRIGLWGTPWHFLEVNKVCREITGYEIRTVPVLGIVKLTREYLDECAERPASLREGSVFNTKSMTLPHFKAKSREYLLKVA